MSLRSLDLSSSDALRWRLVGPYRGGRVTSVVGHPHEPMRFYAGSSSGGVWQTDNGGTTWRNISDGFFTRGSVGALALAESAPNVLYAGGGACGLRSNVTHGDGVFRSDDGGATWQHRGLAATHNIARVRVHPRDPDLVYVAAFGHRFGPNPERGVFRSRDGGASWEHVLFQGDDVGAIDLAIDLTNPRVLYAAFWQAQLWPWGRVNGGAGSGLWRSSDGGDTWTDLTQQPGFPRGPLGRIGVCASPVQAGRVWAQIDAPKGGIYRSDDGGARWTWLSDDRNFLVRSWYFMHLAPDPQDADTLYVVNRKLWKSIDGGRTYRQINVPYVDEHDLWIDPRDPRRMILGNDGGAAVSFNGGESWSTLTNQPTAEIYRAAADTHFPYRIYGSQQDNSTLCMPSRSDLGPISQFGWYDIGGGESGAIAVRPDNPNIVYSGDLPGLGVTRYDHQTHQLREIAPWLDTEAAPGETPAVRYNWTTPIALSPHDPGVLYVAGNVLFRSVDEGQSWQPISPDLTRNDARKLAAPGESNTGENSNVNDYCTISSFAESPCAPGMLWVGTDDGLVQLSRDAGATWADVTPPDLPPWATTCIEPSAHDPRRAFVSATLHQRDDFRPLIWKTTDSGQTWQMISDGIPADQFVRVIREDPARRGLLYAGTEAGVYVSLDDGARWQTLQGNLPIVAIYDLLVHNGDLIAATHGRGMWILDDLTPLHQLPDAPLDAAAHLFTPRPAYRLTRQAYGLDSLLTLYAPYAAANPPAGVVATYYLRELAADTIVLELRDGDGEVVSAVTSAVTPPARVPLGPPEFELRAGAAHLTRTPPDADEPGIKWGPLTPIADPAAYVVGSTPGVHRVVLDLRYRGVPGGGITAPLALPGTYSVRLRVGTQTWTAPVAILADPRVAASQPELEAQFALMVQIRATVAAIQAAVAQIRDLQRQLAERARAATEHPRAADVQQAAAVLRAQLAAVEALLIQPVLHARSGELAGTEHPPRLDERLRALGYAVARSDNAPTAQSRALFAELAARVDQQLEQLQALIHADIAAFNQLFADAGIPAVIT